jgi:hypothetical protein
MHESPFAPQSVHEAPPRPHALFAVPPRHVPLASQHPPQLEAPHAGAVPWQLP